ncbi:isoprenylcysteine carboxylmethyltransferase family protein [bacterium]|nr:isoprenylcysteine carboxylmethyltransferase family protein [bacterium]
MDLAGDLRRIDFGRVIAVPVFSLLMFINIFSFWKDAGAFFPINTTRTIGLIHNLLIIFFYALVVLLYFLRTSASSTTKSFMAKAIAIIATFLPFAFPHLKRQIIDNASVVLIANLIMTLSMAFSAWALFTLGKSFSIIPQARGLVQNGPYRMVRHPLYLGEIVSVSGMFMARPAISTMAVLLLLVSCQIYRAFQEELLLNEIFPEYEVYRMKTARFIPGVF